MNKGGVGYLPSYFLILYMKAPNSPTRVARTKGALAKLWGKVRQATVSRRAFFESTKFDHYDALLDGGLTKTAGMEMIGIMVLHEGRLYEGAEVKPILDEMRRNAGRTINFLDGHDQREIIEKLFSSQFDYRKA